MTEQCNRDRHERQHGNQVARSDGNRAAPVNNAVTEAGVKGEESDHEREAGDQLPAPGLFAQSDEGGKNEDEPGVGVEQPALPNEGDLRQHVPMRPAHAADAVGMGGEGRALLVGVVGDEKDLMKGGPVIEQQQTATENASGEKERKATKTYIR